MVGLIQEPVRSELPDDYDFSHKETLVSLTEDPWKGLNQGHIVHSWIVVLADLGNYIRTIQGHGEMPIRSSGR